ncbi:MAG TPA: outer membrane beta-barrel protein [Rhizomicrobium sp.]|nr:outer membrane beta-barrel protein [Rhizomicrobium sp.]
MNRRLIFGGVPFGIVALVTGGAQATALSTPSMSGPLAANPNPISFDAGPLGKIYVGGDVSGLGFWQDNPVPGNQTWRADLGNGQIFVQKTDGWLQFYVQAGAYSLPALGTPYLNASDTISDTYGVVPVAYAKIAPTDNFSIEAGKLPTLIGEESTFTFQNMDIERGLLWNQEPAVSRGVQANYSSGPVSVAFSLNDGFYSNRLNWLTGSVAYTIDSTNSLTFIGGGNTGHTGHSSFATPPAQNNGDIFNLIYSWTSGPWTLSPYLQYANVPTDTALGIDHSAPTTGGAALISYAINDDWKLAGRGEYIGASGNDIAGTPDLLYGPGSDAWSLTVTPTYQHGIFFARGEASYVGVGHTAAGYVFGPHLDQTSQARLTLETGVLF